MLSCGLILLAAGASRRLQQAKQLLPYQGTTLLHHSIQTALSASVHPVIVVAVPGSDATVPEDDRLRLAFNYNREEGLASSIRCGVTALLNKAPETEAAILMVCDQPFVTPGLLNSLQAACEQQNKQIAACSYKNTLGTPVFFKRSFFNQLMALKGDEGAKRIIQKNQDQTAIVPFPKGEIDIDTMEDYETLLQHTATL
ncbi:MAG: nucleotidyltransferase family protein [Williamsia sp.]|nr:nucleotidyltransferase family protein [Williamsia sp.]